MTYRYYFSNTGKAYKGGTFFGENYLLVKKIGGKYYGFNRYAQMVKAFIIPHMDSPEPDLCF